MFIIWNTFRKNTDITKEENIIFDRLNEYLGCLFMLKFKNSFNDLLLFIISGYWLSTLQNNRIDELRKIMARNESPVEAAIILSIFHLFPLLTMSFSYPPNVINN